MQHVVLLLDVIVLSFNRDVFSSHVLFIFFHFNILIINLLFNGISSISFRSINFNDTVSNEI